MLTLHPNILEKEGVKEFVVLPFDEYEIREKIDAVLKLLTTLESGYFPLAKKEISEIHMEDYKTAIIYPMNIPFPIVMDLNRLPEDMERLKTLISYLRDNGTLCAVQSIRLDYGDRAVVAFKDRIL